MIICVCLFIGFLSEKSSSPETPLLPEQVYEENAFPLGLILSCSSKFLDF